MCRMNAEALAYAVQTNTVGQESSVWTQVASRLQQLSIVNRNAKEVGCPLSLASQRLHDSLRLRLNERWDEIHEEGKEWPSLGSMAFLFNATDTWLAQYVKSLLN